ncbi:MAG: HlyD family efflux transporter periplasmic adaptor subunit [Saprospiraceae bacterium]|nr:HlyD family efflux transporter periplasmic adaptor subunit [Saprospiraceae bacterium]
MNPNTGKGGSMEEREYVELRSEEVHEILGTPPGWMVSWGTLSVLFCFTLLILVGSAVRYPDVIPAKIVLTTATPPVDVVARTNGHLSELLVSDTHVVKRDQLLAVLQSTADYEDVLMLDVLAQSWAMLTNTDTFVRLQAPSNLDLGEVQGEYADFVQKLDQFKFGQTDKTASIGASVSSNNAQIKKLESSIVFDRNALMRTRDQLESARDFLRKQQELFNAGIISRVELEKEKQRVADLERQIEQLDDNILRKQNEILSLRKNSSDERFSGSESSNNAETQLRNSLNNLRSSIDRWKQSYLLRAPIDGRVSLNSAFYSRQQYIRDGDQLLAIVPLKTDSIIGRVSLPVSGSGKVLQGQKVIIKLDSYPFYEFGSLTGTVRAKSLVPKDNAYLIYVDLPKKLVTNHNREIEFEQQLQGSAEIITNDKSFLRRISEQMFAGWTN